MRSSAALLILISCFFAKFARSQSNELLIQGQTGGLYLEHTVVAKENWYSVGRMFNIDPKALAPFNHSALTQPLMIGQLLQIPLTATNFSQTGQKATGETLVPVYCITQDKEWLYRVSVNHNKVPIPTLEKWNNITPEQVHTGMHLIVGYLKVKTSQSALAKMPPPVPAVASAPPPPVAANQATTPPATTAQATTPATTTTQPATSTATTPPATASAPPVGTSAAPPPPTTTSAPPPITKPAPSTSAITGETDSPVSKPPVSTRPASTPQISTPPAPHFNGGAFRADFSDGGHSATGPAGVFKSTSGWQDGKYYALMNNVTIGAIVRITDPASGKSVYAKILGQLPDMKESAGLTIRISNAAAAELGQGEGRFNVLINY
jgi:hypothetical protein